MKYLIVAGARPNFMKIASIHRAFSTRRNGLSDADLLLVHTDQHYSRNKSDDFFRDLGILEPDINLEVGSGCQAGQDHAFAVELPSRFRKSIVLLVGQVSRARCLWTTRASKPKMRDSQSLSKVVGSIRNGEVTEEDSRLHIRQPRCSVTLQKR